VSRHALTFFLGAGWGTRTENFSAFSSVFCSVGAPADGDRADAVVVMAFAPDTTTGPCSKPP